MSKIPKLYKCDPNKNIRCRKTNCYMYGGACKYTFDRRFKKPWFIWRRKRERERT